jgi:hypothetical protein
MRETNKVVPGSNPAGIYQQLGKGADFVLMLSCVWDIMYYMKRIGCSLFEFVICYQNYKCNDNEYDPKQSTLSSIVLCAP